MSQEKRKALAEKRKAAAEACAKGKIKSEEVHEEALVATSPIVADATYSKQIFKIRTPEKEGVGFVMTDGTGAHLYTARHVIEGAELVQVCIEDQWLNAGGWKCLPNCDLARTFPPKSVKALRKGTTILQDLVRGVSLDIRTPDSRSTGKYAGVDKDAHSTPLIKATYSSREGFSGAPILCGNVVVGVHFGAPPRESREKKPWNYFTVLSLNH
jgi:hypothetical protein